MIIQGNKITRESRISVVSYPQQMLMKKNEVNQQDGICSEYWRLQFKQYY